MRKRELTELEQEFCRISARKAAPLFAKDSAKDFDVEVDDGLLAAGYSQAYAYTGARLIDGEGVTPRLFKIWKERRNNE